MSEALAAWLGGALPALRVVPTLWLATRALGALRPGLFVAVGLALAMGLRGEVGPLPVDAWLIVAALRELALGTALALTLGAPLVAMSVAGAWIDRPWAGTDGPLARLLGLVGAATLLAAGAHRGVLRALAATYAVLPPSGRGWSAIGSWSTALRATTDALAAAGTLSASVLFSVVAMELTLALAGRIGRPLGDAELRVPLRDVAALGTVALTLGAFTGATRALALAALDTVTALR